VSTSHPQALYEPVSPKAKNSVDLYELCATCQKAFPALDYVEIDKKRYHSTQYQEDAHQIIEDFRKNHYDDTEDQGNDSSNET
jgi:hypothetical protein